MFLPMDTDEKVKVESKGCAHRSVLLHDGVPFAQRLLFLVVCRNTLSLARSRRRQGNENRRGEGGDKTFSA